jgi:transcriptional regulator with XRE-family HTH domain
MYDPEDIDDVLNKQFGLWLRNTLRRKGITIEELAFLTDIPKQRIEALIKGTANPSLLETEIVKISEVLKIPIKQIQMINNEVLQ